jgi:hypothetical protein
MTITKRSTFPVLMLMLFFIGTIAKGQTTKAEAPATESAKQSPAAFVPATQIEATQKFKASSEELLRLQEDAVNDLKKKTELLRQLYAEGLIAKIELDESEQALATAEAELRETRNQISGSDKLISEIKKAEELAKLQVAQRGLVKPMLQARTSFALGTTATILRSNGAGSWSLANLSNVQKFFSASFGRALPTSAVGQSATHDRLGYDHRNAVDVALHPDSVEGRALISYLQSAGIPFLAFRAAVPGVATGPHIHIGSSSHRIA